MDNIFESYGVTLYSDRFNPTKFIFPNKDNFIKYDNCNQEEKLKMIEKFLFNHHYIKMNDWKKLIPTLTPKNSIDEEILDYYFKEISILYSREKNFTFKFGHNRSINKKMQELFEGDYYTKKMSKKFQIKTMFLTPEQKVRKFKYEIVQVIYVALCKNNFRNDFINVWPKFILDKLDKEDIKNNIS